MSLTDNPANENEARLQGETRATVAKELLTVKAAKEESDNQ
jgi:hypothetical protein